MSNLPDMVAGLIKELAEAQENARAYKEENERNQEILKAIRDIFGYSDEPIDLVTYIAEDVGRMQAAVFGAILPTLQSYRCHYTTDAEDGGGLPLVDKLCAPGVDDIRTGREEMVLLAETICANIEDALDDLRADSSAKEDQPK